MIQARLGICIIARLIMTYMLYGWFDGWWLLYNLSLVVYSSESNIPGESSHAMNSVFLPDQTVRHTLVRLTDRSCHRALASTVSVSVRQTGKHALGGQTSTFSGFLLMREIGHWNHWNMFEYKNAWMSQLCWKGLYKLVCRLAFHTDASSIYISMKFPLGRQTNRQTEEALFGVVWCTSLFVFFICLLIILLL